MAAINHCDWPKRDVLELLVCVCVCCNNFMAVSNGRGLKQMECMGILRTKYVGLVSLPAVCVCVFRNVLSDVSSESSESVFGV